MMKLPSGSTSYAFSVRRNALGDFGHAGLVGPVQGSGGTRVLPPAVWAARSSWVLTDWTPQDAAPGPGWPGSRAAKLPR
jgi:hypothetical protein